MIKPDEPQLNCLQATTVFTFTLTTKKQEIPTLNEHMMNGLLNAWAILWASLTKLQKEMNAVVEKGI